MFIEDAKLAKAGSGIVNRVKSWRPHLVDADLVIGDMVGFGYLESTMKRLGKRYLGISEIADYVELDRKAGINLMRDAGILVPDTMFFENPADARLYGSALPEQGVVIKPSGNISTARTVLVHSKDEYLYELSRYDPSQELIVQTIVEGIEISTEGWFNGRDWIRPFNHTFEEKRLFNGGIGPNTGCMGNVVVKAKESSKLLEDGLLLLGPWLRKHSYKGPIDLNTIVNIEGVWGLELTPRLGYDAIEALAESLREPLGDLLFETAAGTKKEIQMSDNPSIAVRVSLPPWPHDEPEESDVGRPIEVGGDVELNMKHIIFTDAYKEDDKYFYSAGDGVLLKAVAFGRSVDEARTRVYKTIRSIKMSDLQYRTDIGRRVNDAMRDLEEMGYL